MATRSWVLLPVFALLAASVPAFLPVFRPKVYKQVPYRSDQPTSETSYYFYNEVTGEVQLQDPGDVPYEDAGGVRYWVLPDGTRVTEHPSAFKYVWVEQYSRELSRAFFYNQETKESTWDRPPDLAWRRIQLT